MAAKLNAAINRKDLKFEETCHMCSIRTYSKQISMHIDLVWQNLYLSKNTCITENRRPESAHRSLCSPRFSLVY